MLEQFTHLPHILLCGPLWGVPLHALLRSLSRKVCVLKCFRCTLCIALFCHSTCLAELISPVRGARRLCILFSRDSLLVSYCSFSCSNITSKIESVLTLVFLYKRYRFYVCLCHFSGSLSPNFRSVFSFILSALSRLVCLQRTFLPFLSTLVILVVVF